MTGPRIESIRTQRFDIALRSPIRMAFGEVAVRNFVLVRIRDSDGVEGVGETGSLGGPYWGPESGESIEAAVNLYIKPLLIGRPLDGLNALAALVGTAIRGNAAARNGIEMAALDLLARRRGQRACDLLGGTCTERLHVAWTLSTGSVESDIEDGERAIAERGHRRFKLKFGGTPAKADVERAERIVDAFQGRATVVADVNQAWGRVTAARYLPRLADAGLEAIEQPLEAQDLRGIGSLVANLGMDVIADEAVKGPEAMLGIATAQAASAVSLKPNRDGGPSATRKVAHVALAAGLGLYGGTMLETTLGTAASAHLFGTLGELRLGTELFGPFRLAEDICTEPLGISAGCLAIPNGPGFGVNLDEEKIEFLVRRTGRAVD